MFMNKKLIFVLTLFYYWSIVGLNGGYAMCKHPIAEQFGYSETFLGILDGWNFAGRTLGSIYIFLFPLKQPKYTLFFHALLIVFFASFMIFAKMFHGYDRFITTLSMFLSGFGRAFIVLTYIIMTKSFKEEKEKKLIHIWFGSINIGNVLFVILVSWIIQTLGLDWSVGYGVCLLSLLGAGIAIQLLLKQFQILDSKEKEPIPQQRGKMEHIKENISIIREFLKNMKHVLWLAECLLEENHIMIISMWLPFYYIKINFGFEASIVSIIFLVTQSFGTSLIQFLLSFCQSKSKLIISIMVMMNVVLYGILIKFSQRRQAIVLLGISGFLFGVGYTRTVSTQIIELTGKDEKKKLIVITFFRMGRLVVILFSMILVGWLMQKELYYLFYVILVNIFFICVAHVGRRIVEVRQLRDLQARKNEQIELSLLNKDE